MGLDAYYQQPVRPPPRKRSHSASRLVLYHLRGRGVHSRVPPSGPAAPAGDQQRLRRVPDLLPDQAGER